MARIILQEIVDDLKLEQLPYNWTSFDLHSFSKTKSLWDFQIRAVENAIKVLWKYYEDFGDFQHNEDMVINQARKRLFWQWYCDNDLNIDMDINLDRRHRSIYNLLTNYYPLQDGKVPYENMINRMCFWMATGSGKTIVIIKLIQILKRLIDLGEIPQYDILFLSYRDDLIEQFKKQVDEVNYANTDKIELRELREYPEVKRSGSIFGSPIFYYRSDNLSDEQKEKIIDFKNYDDNGKWFIFLDEAHKGDKEDSKRQHIYAILSRNGFLFNFSATFVDIRDIVTSAFEFNLGSFIRAGYGKHINILNQEFRAFRQDEDFNIDEKQKIVLKSLMLLTYVKKFHETICRNGKFYHNPLLLTLVNSINAEDADLKLFFGELEKIGNGQVNQPLFEQCKKELLDEFTEKPEFIFEEGETIAIEEEILNKITIKDILKCVYNTSSPGEIEVSFRPSDRKQVAFKLTTSDKHFALSKTGDIPNWLREELSRFNVNHQFEEEGFFERINRDDSPINILMGSRAFYEGWDSNRPNIINFINIGTGTDAKKFILQSVGRGVRIEPVANSRRRLLELYNSNEIDKTIFNKLKNVVLPIETLSLFGTNRNALLTVIKELKNQESGKGLQLSLFLSKEIKDRLLLIPTYKLSDYPVMKRHQVVRYDISARSLDSLTKYVDYLSDDRLFLMKYETTPEKIKMLRSSLADKDKFYKPGGNDFANLDLLIQRIFGYFSVVPEELKELKELNDEICHFKNIKVYLKDISEIQGKINQVRDYPLLQQELSKQYSKIPPEEYAEKARRLKDEEVYQSDHREIIIRYLSNHYYVPLILSKDEKVNYINHIIKTPSEVRFIKDLANYISQENNKFKEFNWWLFSKIDQSLDAIYMPYYNPNLNKISYFFPDFIFWLQKGKDYIISFVDPKGIEHISGWIYKIDNGYKELFESDGIIKSFTRDGFKIKIILRFRTTDLSKVPAEYRKYWFDDIERITE